MSNRIPNTHDCKIWVCGRCFYMKGVWRPRSCEVLMTVSLKWEITQEAYGVKLVQSSVKSGVHRFYKNLGTSSKLLEPVVWLEKSSMLRTRSSVVEFEPHCYLAFSVWCSWTDTCFCLWGKKTNSCATSVGCHGAKFSHPSALAPGICASLSEVRILYMCNCKYPNKKLPGSNICVFHTSGLRLE